VRANRRHVRLVREATRPTTTWRRRSISRPRSHPGSLLPADGPFRRR
jgi:hypothetical protein